MERIKKLEAIVARHGGWETILAPGFKPSRELLIELESNGYPERSLQSCKNWFQMDPRERQIKALARDFYFDRYSAYVTGSRDGSIPLKEIDWNDTSSLFWQSNAARLTKWGISENEIETEIVANPHLYPPFDQVAKAVHKKRETNAEGTATQDAREAKLRGIAHMLCRSWAAHFNEEGHQYCVADLDSVLAGREVDLPSGSIPEVISWPESPDSKFWSRLESTMERFAISRDDVGQEISNNSARYWRAGGQRIFFDNRQRAITRIAKGLLSHWNLFYARKREPLPKVERWTDIPVAGFWDSRQAEMDELGITLDEIEAEIRRNPDRYSRARDKT